MQPGHTTTELPDNGRGGGGFNPFIVKSPIPAWALALLADQQISATPGTAKLAIYEYLTEMGEINVQYNLAIAAAESAAQSAKHQADQQLRKKLLA